MNHGMEVYQIRNRFSQPSTPIQLTWRKPSEMNEKQTKEVLDAETGREHDGGVCRGEFGAYRKCQWKRVLYLMLSVFSVGVVPLLCHWYPHLWLTLNTSKCAGHAATHVYAMVSYYKALLSDSITYIRSYQAHFLNLLTSVRKVFVTNPIF